MMTFLVFKMPCVDLVLSAVEFGLLETLRLAETRSILIVM